MKTGRKKIEIEFDANELVRRMEGLAAGTEPVRERTIRVPFKGAAVKSRPSRKSKSKI